MDDDDGNGQEIGGDQLEAAVESEEGQAEKSNLHEADTNTTNASDQVVVNHLPKHAANCEISSGTTSFVNALNLAQQGLLIPPPPLPPPPTPQPFPPTAVRTSKFLSHEQNIYAHKI